MSARLRQSPVGITPEGRLATVLASPVARHDFAHFVWSGCRVALEAAAAASTSPEPLHLRLDMDQKYLRRLLRGQSRLTLDTFTYIAATLGLDPAIVFRTAAQDAIRLLTGSTD